MFSKILAVIGFVFLGALAYLFLEVEKLKDQRDASQRPVQASSISPK